MVSRIRMGNYPGSSVQSPDPVLVKYSVAPTSLCFPFELHYAAILLKCLMTPPRRSLHRTRPTDAGWSWASLNFGGVSDRSGTLNPIPECGLSVL